MTHAVEDLNEFCQQNGYRAVWCSKKGYVKGEEKWQVRLEVKDKAGRAMYSRQRVCNTENRALELCCLEIVNQAKGMHDANKQFDYYTEKVAPYETEIEFTNCIFNVEDPAK